MSIQFLIVVPTLDSFQLLSRLVDSVKSQTWPYWRILFVDGPSSSRHKAWLRNSATSDSRISVLDQDPNEKGIFGAMNQGFSYALPSEYILFWGSDDWAASPDVFSLLAGEIDKSLMTGHSPHLIISSARYVDQYTGSFLRNSCFSTSSILNKTAYSRSLFLGSTPPHQGTLFSPLLREHLNRYSSSFHLSADLDYFLRARLIPRLSVICLPLELVRMSSGGVSARQTRQRLTQVYSCYKSAFGWLWWIPFCLRYLRRSLSAMKTL